MLEHRDGARTQPRRLRAFWMDQYEVTHEMFAKVQLPDPSHWQDGPNKPVERVVLVLVGNAHNATAWLVMVKRVE